MKFIYKLPFCLPLVATIVAIQCPTQAQDEAIRERKQQIKLFTDVMVQRIPVPQEKTTVDDYIFSLAIASKTNIICDVTEIAPETLVDLKRNSLPETAEATALNDANPTLWIALGDFMEQQRMTHRQFAPRAILMWHPHDPLTFGHEILADWKQKQQSLAMPPAEPGQLTQAWSNYFKGLGWDGKSLDVNLQVKLADLPAEARKLVLNEAWKRLFWNAELDCFDDERWPNAKIEVSNAFRIQNEPLEPYLILLQSQTEIVEDITGLTENASTTSLPLGPASAPPVAEMDEITAELTKPLTIVPNPAKEEQATIRALPAEAIKGDALLSKEVSLEIRRGGLQQILQALSEQSNVKLQNNIDEQDRLSSRKITAKIEKLTLSEAMLALSQLTGAIWTREQDSYILQSNREDVLQYQLRQIGDPKDYRLRDNAIPNMKARLARNSRRLQGVLTAYDQLKLETTDGRVSISKLTPELQNELRLVAQQEALRSLPLKALMARELIENGGREDELILQLSQATNPLFATWLPTNSISTYALNSKGMLRGPDLTLTLRRPDGQLVSTLFTHIQWLPTPKQTRPIAQ